MERVVSSANNLALVVWRHLGKSLIYKRNKNGPRLDPCGTPHLSSFTSDCLTCNMAREVNNLLTQFPCDYFLDNIALMSEVATKKLPRVTWHAK